MPRAAPSFYRCAPSRAVALDELQEAGHARVKLLARVAAQEAVPSRRPTRELTAETTPFQRNSPTTSEIDASVDADALSHFALRLAFCRSPRDWDWLVDAETKLFVSRVSTLAIGAAVALLASEGVRYAPIRAQDAQFTAETRVWMASREGPERHDVDKSRRGILYRVPFSDACALVKQRRVVMAKGWCLVPDVEMGHVAAQHFRRSLTRQLRDLRCALAAQHPEIDRLGPLLDEFVALARSLDGSGARNPRGTHEIRLDVTTIDRVAPRDFPLCMQQMHRKLRESHHLKYDGRLQYRMFLKGAGLSVHDSLRFFRGAFASKTPATTFDKKYAYSIRHSYGLEGSRRDYAPLDCEQIIAGAAPGHGQCHGCPFKHWGRTALQGELQRQRLATDAVLEIGRLAAVGRYQVACRAYYDATHVTDTASMTRLGARVTHPNEYLASSLHASPKAKAT